MPKSKRPSIDRRKFLQSATVGTAALAASSLSATAGQLTGPAPQSPPAGNATASLPPASRNAQDVTHDVDIVTVDRPGSDFMLDVIKTIGFEYVCANPGNTFRGLHESIINYGNNQSPELITCCHEESAVAMAHGYAKIEGKPILACVHGTVGAQHAAMAIYDAFCDRVPVYLILGNIENATTRESAVNWAHSAQDPASLVRDFVKWDDQPVSLAHFAESAMRAYKIAMTPPMMPVVLVADADLQERPVPADADLRIPKLTVAEPPQGDHGSVVEAARLLVAAENPVIVLDRAARTPAGLTYLVELAETLQAAVVDRNGRMNFPTRHPLNQTESGRQVISDADVILGLELADFFGTVNSYHGEVEPFVESRQFTKPTAKLISITVNDLFTKSNYQEFQRYQAVDLAMAADAEATLPALIEEVKRLIDADRTRTYEDRGAKLAAAHQRALDRTKEAATYAWDVSPITTARLAAELWAQIKDEDWSLASYCQGGFRWPLRLWNFDKHYQYLGSGGGYGIGYNAPATIGAALANRKHGRLTVSIQTDGDLMYAPGVLWTAAHHHIPILIVMNNNRAYHQEVMEVQHMANQRERGVTRAGIGTTLLEPNIDFTKIAQGMGIYARGPVSDPKELGPAIREAIGVVKRGEPALVDVVMQPR
jgi:acetolactate synthase-1/2/3 large subunit